MRLMVYMVLLLVALGLSYVSLYIFLLGVLALDNGCHFGV